MVKCNLIKLGMGWPEVWPERTDLRHKLVRYPKPDRTLPVQQFNTPSSNLTLPLITYLILSRYSRTLLHSFEV